MEIYLKLLRDLQQEKFNIQQHLAYDIISVVDATNELEVINKKELRIKEELVQMHHVGKRGNPKLIKFQEGKALWVTIMPDGTKKYAKTREDLIDKLFDYYGLDITNKTIKEIFSKALEEKKNTENSSNLTIERYEQQYDQFITEDFGKRDISKITKAELKEYTQEMVNRLHPKKKAFYGFKSVLNLIFNYALEYDIIDSNPVLAIKNNAYLKSCDNTKAKPEEKIFSKDEIEHIKQNVYDRMAHPRYNGYFIYGYVILLAIETGMRAGELCALKWSDIHEDYIHIHAQQLIKSQKGIKEYYYAEGTKNEKGIPRGGRQFPLTEAISDLLDELKVLQQGKGIKSEFIFCKSNGEWITKNAYGHCLLRFLKSIGVSLTNNHAFRMSLNSNVLIPLGIPATDRARLLGQSVPTNLNYYSHPRIDAFDEIREQLNGVNGIVSPKSHQNIINFDDFNKEKSPLNREFKGLS